jgi:hypothetical protein
MMPASMNPNAGMSDQEQQMVKAVGDTPRNSTWSQTRRPTTMVRTDLVKVALTG